MIQKIYIPKDHGLRQIVNFLSYVEITSEDYFEGFTAIFPNATSNLLLSLNKDIYVNHSLTENFLYASCASTVAFQPYIGMAFMAVQFNSYGLYYLKHIPAQELHDSLFNPNILFSESDLSRIKCQLKELSSIEQKFIVLESFLIQRIELTNFDSRLPFAIATLKSKQHISLDKLSESLCISNRGLQKLFKKYVGMSPVYFRKIARFNHAANLILNSPDLSLSNVTYECGYYDQSHFIKDFKKFGGISPSGFSHLKTKSSDFYNYNLKDIDTLGHN